MESNGIDADQFCYFLAELSNLVISKTYQGIILFLFAIVNNFL